MRRVPALGSEAEDATVILNPPEDGLSRAAVRDGEPERIEGALYLSL